MFFVLILTFLWPSLNILLYPFLWGSHSQETSKALYQSSCCTGYKGTRHLSQHPCHEPFIATKGAVFMTRLIISQSWCRRCQIHCWRTRIIWTLLFEMERCQGLQTESPVNWLMMFHFFQSKSLLWSSFFPLILCLKGKLIVSNLDILVYSHILNLKEFKGIWYF